MNERENIVHRLAQLDEIIALRHAVLCAGQPWSEAQFKGDDDPPTRHFGAFVENGDSQENICCVSYMRADYEGRPAWQLRGMATLPHRIGQGIGRQLVKVAERHLLAESPLRLMWCKARVPAIGFYEKLGWRVVSEEYVVGVYGPHRNMMVELDREQRVGSSDGD